MIIPRSNNPLSRFVTEIPRELLDEQTPSYDAYAYTPQRPAFKTYYSAPREERTPVSPKNYVGTPYKSEPVRPQNQTRFSVGDRVSHRMFGEGEIFSAKPMGADVLYEVIFDTAGTKKLMGSFAKLKKL